MKDLPMIDGCRPETVFTYSFCAWPTEQWGFTKSLYELFEFLKRRIEMQFTEVAFEVFRSSLSHDGISLREIERVPYLHPEDVH